MADSPSEPPDDGGSRKGSSRRRRIPGWGLLGVAVALGLSLLGSTLLAYSEADALAPTLARGQGETYLRAFREYTRPEYGPPSRELLEQLLEQHRSSGLRGLTLSHVGGRDTLSAGEPAYGMQADGLLPGEVRFIRGRVVMVAPPPPLPPPPGGRWMPPPKPPGATAEPSSGWPPPPPPPDASLPAGLAQARLVLEFEPLAAERLLDRARLTLLFGLVASVLLVAVAAVLWRLLLRNDQARRELERQRRLATLGEMSSVLAHEIRNPLAAVKGHAQLLAEQLGEDRRQQGRVSIVVEEIQRLERLVTDLLDFARSGAVEPTSAAPAQVLARAAERVDGDRIELEVAAAPDSWLLDAARVEQVLENLLRNALQASPAQATVTATISVDGDALVFDVADRGEGIDPADRDRIFEPFHTTRTRGTGLGLALAHRIVEQHGGRIEVSDPPEGGALFRVRIPRG